jgi:hypothetical protein
MLTADKWDEPLHAVELMLTLWMVVEVVGHYTP